MQVCVVIPAYNEAATIRDVASRALSQCKQVIVVDDGSIDGTAQALAALPVTVLRHASNRGKAAALWSGFERALADGASAVVTLDGDGQHRPEDIPRFLEAAQRHRECIVIGSRIVERAAFPKARYYANCTANFWISWAAGYRIEDSQSGFRLYPASLLKRVRVPHDRAHGFVFESEVLIEAARFGIRSLSLPIAAIYAPGARASHFRSVVDVLRITRMVAWKLVSRALYPQGFARAFLWPRAAGDCADAVTHDVPVYPAHPKKLARGGREQ
jgi:glycosyltransferase involved in cell wall biosynthesis